MRRSSSPRRSRSPSPPLDADGAGPSRAPRRSVSRPGSPRRSTSPPLSGRRPRSGSPKRSPVPWSAIPSYIIGEKILGINPSKMSPRVQSQMKKLDIEPLTLNPKRTAQMLGAISDEEIRRSMLYPYAEIEADILRMKKRDIQKKKVVDELNDELSHQLAEIYPFAVRDGGERTALRYIHEQYDKKREKALKAIESKEKPPKYAERILSNLRQRSPDTTRKMQQKLQKILNDSFEIAFKSRDLKEMKRLIAQGAEIRKDILIDALDMGDMKIFRYLMEQGADVNAFQNAASLLMLVMNEMRTKEYYDIAIDMVNRGAQYFPGQKAPKDKLISMVKSMYEFRRH